MRDLWPSFTDLAAVHGFPFQAREWVEAWLETLGREPGYRPLFLVVETAGRKALAYFPLVVRRRAGIRVLEFVGGDEVSDYHAPLLAPGWEEADRIAEAVWSALHRGPVAFDLLLFARVPKSVAGRSDPFPGWRSRPYRMSGHESALAGAWDSWFENKFGKETRATLRRKRKRLEGFGPVREAFAESSEAALAWLDRLVAFKAERMAEAGQESANALANPLIVEFYRRLTGADPRQAHVRVYAMLVAEGPIAVHWGIEAGGRMTNILTSHAGGEWSRFSPGLQLFKGLFEWCFSHGIGAFDFGVGDESYKDRWCEKRIPLVTVARARTWRGGLVLALISARGRLRNAVLRLNQEDFEPECKTLLHEG